MVITAEFELKMVPAKQTDECDMDCIRKKTQKLLKKSLKKVRRAINKQQFYIRYENRDVEVAKKSFKADKNAALSCSSGTVLIKKKCVACSVGTYFDSKDNKCVLCPKGTYQNKEGRRSCKDCPGHVQGAGFLGAKNSSECTAQCDPGYYSDDGFKPCHSCRVGTYQMDYGRTSCIPCAGGLTTSRTAATGFHHCNAKERCSPGHYFEVSSESCRPCARGKYQPREGQDFCVACPGNTITDFEASTNTSDCKNVKCGGVVGKFQGFLQSPNYPGHYPVNVECVWKIKPEKGRRILVIIPEIDLSKEDECGDALVMRKSKSPYSLATYETCEPREQPIAFTSRSKKMWIQFRSDGQNTASGFSIPFVMYDENYQALIEDIVGDGRIYSTYQHQSILKDRKLLSVLMEVIAQPYNYYKYVNVSKTMIPQTFIKLLTRKVQDFFSRN